VSEVAQGRHLARERALAILYEASIKGRPVATILSELPSRPDAYTVDLLTSAAAHQERAEALISEFSIDWSHDRLALVDRLIMILAVGEMLLESPPPIAVILDEAVELAKVYSTDGSASFVNGVLASVTPRVLD